MVVIESTNHYLILSADSGLGFIGLGFWFVVKTWSRSHSVLFVGSKTCGRALWCSVTGTVQLLRME